MVLDNRHVLIGMLLALLVTEGSSQLGSGDKDNYVPGTVLPLGYGSGGPFQPDKDIVPDLDATHPPEAVVTSSSTTDPPEPVDSTKCNETFHFENGKYYVKTTREPFESPDTVVGTLKHIACHFNCWQQIYIIFVQRDETEQCYYLDCHCRSVL
eukprot:scpid95556/ scgid5142/ 